MYGKGVITAHDYDWLQTLTIGVITGAQLCLTTPSHRVFVVRSHDGEWGYWLWPTVVGAYLLPLPSANVFTIYVLWLITASHDCLYSKGVISAHDYDWLQTLTTGVITGSQLCLTTPSHRVFVIRSHDREWGCWLWPTVVGAYLPPLPSANVFTIYVLWLITTSHDCSYGKGVITAHDYAWLQTLTIGVMTGSQLCLITSSHRVFVVRSHDRE